MSREVGMILDEILKGIQPCEHIELQSEAHPSLHTPKGIFYINTKYIPLKVSSNSKFIIFSAPGASGKSALAQYLVDIYGGIYWDLSQIAIGENTFQGTLWKALKQEQLLKFWKNLSDGKGVLTLDAFDEAELISGRSGVEYFLRDVNEVASEITVSTIFIFARTETAKFIEKYCINHKIIYSMFEISFFAEKEAKEFVRQRFIKLGNKFTPAVSECIEEQFSIIKNLLSNSNMSESFLGYAPVLEALSSALDASRNTIRMLGAIRSDTNASAKIVFGILNDLLLREQEKVVNALRERCHLQLSGYENWENVYTHDEQLVRIMEYIFFRQFEESSLFTNEYIPAEVYNEYIEIVHLQLVQHPFLQNLNQNNGFDFAGPAFRDYTLSCIMCSEYSELAIEYLNENSIGGNKFSQLLFDFFVEHNGVITDSNFSIIYDAFKAKEETNKKCRVDVYLDGDEGSVIFSMLMNENELIYETEMPFLCNNKAFTVLRISNTKIITDKEVIIGHKSTNTQISDSFIIAGRIVFSTQHLLITSSKENKSVLISKKEVLYNDFGVPQFDIRCEKGIDICFPNINAFYRLRKYSASYEEFSYQDFMRFYVFVTRVLGLISKHKQYVGKKDKEFIDNKMIGTNLFKRCLMDFLIDIGIIYKVHNELRWYEVDVDCLAKYGLSQVIGILDNEQALKGLYTMFLMSDYYQNYLEKH